MRIDNVKIGLEVKYKNKIVTIINYNRETTNDSLPPDVVIGLGDGWRCDANHSKLELIKDTNITN
jgi:hypothetical protein